jgi:ketosteroid isomerase-like protein
MIRSVFLAALAATALLAGAPKAAAQAATTSRFAGSQLPETLRDELLREREAIWRAWFANDRRELEALLPAHVVAINNADTTWQDRAAVLASAEAFARAEGKLHRLVFPRTEFQVYGDVAILYSLFELEVEQAGARTVQAGRATEVFLRRNGRWQNAGWHLDSGR